MAEGVRTYRFGDETIDAPSNLTPEEVRDAWKEVHPGLENAEIVTMSDDSVEFHVRAGSKG
jgi:phage terminase small subunit